MRSYDRTKIKYLQIEKLVVLSSSYSKNPRLGVARVLVRVTAKSNHRNREVEGRVLKMLFAWQYLVQPYCVPHYVRNK